MATSMKRACMGAATREVRSTEWMERCRACGTEVRRDLIDHPFFGFRAGCDAWRRQRSPNGDSGGDSEPSSRDVIE